MLSYFSLGKFHSPYPQNFFLKMTIRLLERYIIFAIFAIIASISKSASEGGENFLIFHNSPSRFTETILDILDESHHNAGKNSEASTTKGTFIFESQALVEDRQLYPTIEKIQKKGHHIVIDFLKVDLQTMTNLSSSLKKYTPNSMISSWHFQLPFDEITTELSSQYPISCLRSPNPSYSQRSSKQSFSTNNRMNGNTRDDDMSANNKYHQQKHEKLNHPHADQLNREQLNSRNDYSSDYAHHKPQHHDQWNHDTLSHRSSNHEHQKLHRLSHDQQKHKQKNSHNDHYSDHNESNDFYTIDSTHRTVDIDESKLKSASEIRQLLAHLHLKKFIFSKVILAGHGCLTAPDMSKLNRFKNITSTIYSSICNFLSPLRKLYVFDSAEAKQFSRRSTEGSTARRSADSPIAKDIGSVLKMLNIGTQFTLKNALYLLIFIIAFIRYLL